MSDFEAMLRLRDFLDVQRRTITRFTTPTVSAPQVRHYTVCQKTLTNPDIADAVATMVRQNQFRTSGQFCDIMKFSQPEVVLLAIRS